MNQKLDWNYERYRTRDRLIEYNFNMVAPAPHSAGLPIIYPWENINISILSEQLYQIAKTNGYKDEKELFLKKIAEGDIIFGTLDTFPSYGEQNKLYFDMDSNILYCFQIIKNFTPEKAALINAAIVGKAIIGNTGEEETFLYIPIKSMPISDINTGG